MDILIGIGIDAHRLVEGVPLWLGGVEIPGSHGLEAHSDGDVISHAILDALLGAADLGDKGVLFPSSDDTYKNIRSTQLLHASMAKLRAAGFAIGNIDVSVMCEDPKLEPHIQSMKHTLARAMSIQPEQISIKGTTLERMGFTGRREGIAALAVALLKKLL
ncbi:2-C-methyl-D-erythritol 2,4-cyclodiphosphate synthase [bacterium]|nr:2-C-methyl-D-erythritol 2,4-cyclodiphosphate synthase [bacterium]